MKFKIVKNGRDSLIEKRFQTKQEALCAIAEFLDLHTSVNPNTEAAQVQEMIDVSESCLRGYAVAECNEEPPK